MLTGSARDISDSSVQDDVFSDMLQRLQHLNERISGKEAEIATLSSRKYVILDSKRAHK